MKLVRVFKITKEFAFSASHRLDGLSPGHPCGRHHGHNYIVKVELTSQELNNVGFVQDYGDLGSLKQYIDDIFDHRHLNDVLPGVQPSAENLALHFFGWCKDRWPQTSAVYVSETPKTWAMANDD